MFETKATRRQIKTSDGVTLSYLEAGEGKPFVMVHGWSQTAAQWSHQINHFSKTHRVIAIDLRGHGASENAAFGYRVYRMSKDVRDVMDALDLKGAVMMGHSMGCSVLWGLYDLFGAERIERFVFVDESPSLSNNPVLACSRCRRVRHHRVRHRHVHTRLPQGHHRGQHRAEHGDAARQGGRTGDRPCWQ